jgi:hypothetical protein
MYYNFSQSLTNKGKNMFNLCEKFIPKAKEGVEKSKIDLGTEELRLKRELDITTEPIDLCLKKDLIDETQYTAAVQLRWLYSLRFGCTSIRGYNPLNPKGLPIPRYMDEGWLADMNNLYDEIALFLTQKRCADIVMNTCVHGIFPSFLLKYNTTERAQVELEQLIEGLDLAAAMLDV